jgi:hypothetical protein
MLWRKVKAALCALWLGEALTAALRRNREAADALDAVVKEMLKQ